MMLTSTLENIGLVDAGIIALLGYAVVFFGLILLMIVLIIMGKVFVSRDQMAKAASTAAASAVSAAPAAAPAAAAAPQTAPGSAGSLKLYDVEPKIAAMLMAIVANKMGKPLNELRFISIKEVK